MCCCCRQESTEPTAMGSFGIQLGPCPSVCLSTIYTCPSVCLSIHLSACLPTRLSICLSIHPFCICPPARLSVYPPPCPPGCPAVCPPRGLGIPFQSSERSPGPPRSRGGELGAAEPPEGAEGRGRCGAAAARSEEGERGWGLRAGLQVRDPAAASAEPPGERRHHGWSYSWHTAGSAGRHRGWRWAHPLPRAPSLRPAAAVGPFRLRVAAEIIRKALKTNRKTVSH